MARAKFVKKARKAIPEHGVAVGDSYWWWKFQVGGRGGPKMISKTRPKPSQLTQSEFLSAVYALQEEMAETPPPDTAEDLESLKEDWGARAREIGDEQSDKLGNMPDGLQSSPTGELLQERADAMEAWAEEIESNDVPEREDGQSDEEYLEALHEAFSEIQSTDPGV